MTTGKEMIQQDDKDSETITLKGFCVFGTIAAHETTLTDFGPKKHRDELVPNPYIFHSTLRRLGGLFIAAIFTIAIFTTAVARFLGQTKPEQLTATTMEKNYVN